MATTINAELAELAEMLDAAPLAARSSVLRHVLCQRDNPSYAMKTPPFA